MQNQKIFENYWGDYILEMKKIPTWKIKERKKTKWKENRLILSEDWWNGIAGNWWNSADGDDKIDFSRQ